jgi:hypothetical protein
MKCIMEDVKATKVTLYLSSDLHRQLKIRSAVEGEAMSSLAQQAINFYLTHSDLVAEYSNSSMGRTHRVYDCPNCTASLVLKHQELVEVSDVASRSLCTSLHTGDISNIILDSSQCDEGELVVC